MNVFKNVKLKFKLVGSFIFLALASSIFLFIGSQLAFKRIIDDTIPTVMITGQVSKLAKTLQAESLEFIADGQEDHLEHFSDSANQLKVLVDRLENEVADNSNEDSVFKNLSQLTRRFPVLGQKLIESHSQTLKQMAELDVLEKEAETLFADAQSIVQAKIVKHSQAEDLDQLIQDAVPTQRYLVDFIQGVQVFGIEALRFVASGNENSEQTFQTAEARLEETQQALEGILDANEPAEADLLDRLNGIKERIETKGRGILATHTETLSLLEEMKGLEDGLNTAITETEALANQDVEETTRATAWNIIVVSIAILILASVLGGVIGNAIVQPVYQLVNVAEQIGAGNFTIQANISTTDEIGQLARSFNIMTDQLQKAFDTINDQSAQRIQELEIIAEIGRRLTTILNVDELLHQVVTSIQNTFGYYHVHIYLVDENTGALVMREGTGEVGQQLKANGHKLQPGQGIVGRVASSNEPLLVRNVDEVSGFFRNSLLPKTQAELAVPLRKESKTLGVLDMQSEEVNGFDEQDLVLMQSLADQVVVAVENARLFRQINTSVAKVEALNRRLTRQMWIDIAHKVETTGYTFTKSEVIPAATEWLPAMTQAIQQKELAHCSSKNAEGETQEQAANLAIPLLLRGEVIGVIGIERSSNTPSDSLGLEGQNTNRSWSEDELTAVQIIAEQVALALDAARLTRETERSAWRDQMISETTAMVWSSAEVDNVMRAAISQLGDKLRASEVVIRLGTEADFE